MDLSYEIFIFRATHVPLAGTAEEELECLGITGPENSGAEIYRKGRKKVPCPVVLGKFQWERLAFFVEWSLNFHKFILFSPAVSFLLKGCRGAFMSTGKVAMCSDRGLDGASYRPGPAAFVCWGWVTEWK